ncbi:protein takeout [Cryptotermes secundus]|nr:protein takeout [Cryptotermes secundus]
MWRSGYAVTLLAAVTYASLPLPSYIKPCARSDPDFNICALQHAKETFPVFVKGDRKYKIPRMDPLEIAEMEISEGPSNGGLSLSMRNVKMYGLKHAVLQKTEFDFDRNHVMYDTNIPVLTILGEYEVSGRILLLPISGKGDINITLINSHLTYSYDFDIVERNGNRYHVTKNHKAVVEPTVGLYHLSNLFNGDKLLGTQVNGFLNENWQEIYRSMSPAISEAFAQVVGNIVNTIASGLPYDALFPVTGH